MADGDSSKTPGAHSWVEITTQGESWAGGMRTALAAQTQLRDLFRQMAASDVLFIGCGSTHCLAQYCAPLFQRLTGRRARALPSSELLLQTDAVVSPKAPPLVVALSRSGETTETLLATDKMRKLGGLAVAVTCFDQAPLAQLSAVTLHIPEGRERSFAQTRSFSGMLVAAQTMAALIGQDREQLDNLPRLADDAARVIGHSVPLATAVGGDSSWERVTYLGTGALCGLAAEATIKMKEMSLSTAESYHFMEFRHGPVALVDNRHLVVALISEETRSYEVAVLRDLRRLSARIVPIANADRGLSAEFGACLELGSDLPELTRGVLYMPFLQLLAYHRALSRGRDPDRPRNVVMAIRLEGTEMATDGR